MSTITEKIARLLALAESPYEAEAQAALLRARRLMAEHKLRPEDITPQETKRVIKECVGISSTKLSTPWAVNLSSIIAEHYCCRSFMSKQKGRKTVEIGFVGLEEDFMACKLAFCYAHACVMSRCKEIKKEQNHHYTAATVRQMCNSYGWGFCSGLSAAFKTQTEQHQEWGLVMVVPKEVMQKTAAMKTVTYAQPSTTAWSQQYANLGYKDGQEFDPAHRLKGTTEQNVAQSA